MNLDEFIKRVEEEFDELEPGQIKPEANIDSYLDWNSMNTLMLIALVRAEMNVLINIEDLRSCKHMKDLYELIETKKA